MTWTIAGSALIFAAILVFNRFLNQRTEKIEQRIRSFTEPVGD